MSRVEGPQVFAAILGLVVIAIVVALVASDQIGEIVGSAITGIGMLGMKLLEKNGEK